MKAIEEFVKAKVNICEDKYYEPILSIVIHNSVVNSSPSVKANSLHSVKNFRIWDKSIFSVTDEVFYLGLLHPREGPIPEFTFLWHVTQSVTDHGMTLT